MTDRQTDGRTDRQTEFSSLDRVCIACSAVKMNTDKTDFIWLGSKYQLAKIHSPSILLEVVHVPVSSVVTCLGVQFDS